MPDVPVILCINSGSSSLKFDLFGFGEGHDSSKRLAHGAVERIGLPRGRLWIKGADEQILIHEEREFSTHGVAADRVSEAAVMLGLPTPTAAGHRVVHGGPRYRVPCRVDDSLMQDLRRLIPFAPLHLPSAIQGIEAVAKRFPALAQVACFDTSFHRRMPEVAQRFPFPDEFWEEGILRYGFHGLSYEYIVASLSGVKTGRMVIAHLGNGASLAAVRDGQPVDTTMGFTPSGGLMMGTRSGDLDPGVLLHLLRDKSYSPDRLDELVNYSSGLLGVSGISSDMKTLLDARAREPKAARAIEQFCYLLRKHIGAMAATLNGLDTLVFTGGIGERAAPVREETCQGLQYLGIRIDSVKNAGNKGRGEAVISAPGSACAVRVIPTCEELMIARHTYGALH